MILELLFYYGAALIPLCYFVVTRFRGRRCRAMLITLGCQVLSALGVQALMYQSWKAGDREWFWTSILNIPINVIFIIIYLALTPLGRTYDHRSAPTPPQNNDELSASANETRLTTHSTGAESACLSSDNLNA